MLQERIRKNMREAAVMCIKRLGLANPETVQEDGDGTYVHINSRGRRRTLKCYHGAKDYFANADQTLKYHQVNGFWFTEKRD